MREKHSNGDYSCIVFENFTRLLYGLDEIRKKCALTCRVLQAFIFLQIFFYIYYIFYIYIFANHSSDWKRLGNNVILDCLIICAISNKKINSPLTKLGRHLNWFKTRYHKAINSSSIPLQVFLPIYCYVGEKWLLGNRYQWQLKQIEVLNDKK